MKINWNIFYQKKFWRQFLIYTLVSVSGMMCSHYIPDEYFWYWVVFSLLLGHIINILTYK